MKKGAKILVVDDENAIRSFLKVSLSAEGYEVLEAVNAKEGMKGSLEKRPDLVILDLGLPDLNGIEVLKEIRNRSSVPVIVLTVKDSDTDKVTLLDAGADDYLTKPFSVQELQARIRTALRHTLPTQSGPKFKSGGLEVDFAARNVKFNNTEIKLTATEYDLLKYFIQNAGKVLTQRQILKEIWGPNSVEHSHYLRVYIGQLRKKLTLAGLAEMILTEPGVGYRLNVQYPSS